MVGAPATDPIFFVTMQFSRELCSNRAICALYDGRDDAAEVYEGLTRLLDELETEMCELLFTR